MATKSILGAAAVALIAATSAAAAEPHAVLARLDGSVMVNEGEQFRSATLGMELKAGDRVMAMAGSEGVLSFAGGCQVPVEANSIVTIPEGSPCNGASMNVQAASPMFAQAVGAPVEEEEDDRGAIWWWIGGGVVAGWLIYDQVIDDDDDEEPPPVSP